MRRGEAGVYGQILEPYLHPLCHLSCLKFGLLVVASVVDLHAVAVHADTFGVGVGLFFLNNDGAVLLLDGAEDAVHGYLLLGVSHD